MFKNRILLITGGTGSFGNAVLDRFLGTDIGEIRIFSRDEKKQDDMRHKYKNDKIKFYIGDVRDYDTIHSAMRGVDYVFSAAALKQVPSCEFYPLEAVKTNIEGTANTIEAAITCGVKRLVVLSTDKAVYPINAMGMSKALMEKVMVASSKKTNTLLCGVRYGNVMYSRGSVLPYFVSQIHAGEKLRITHPGMTRFLLTLGDAIDLVLYAFAKGERGYMYIRKSPACTVETLAKAMCKIFNFKKGYVEVGIRPGEKLHETLVSSGETQRAFDLENYFAVPPESQGLDYNRYLPSDKKKHIEIPTPFTSENTRRLDVAQTVDLLLTVPKIREERKKWLTK